MSKFRIEIDNPFGEVRLGLYFTENKGSDDIDFICKVAHELKNTMEKLQQVNHQEE